MEGFAEIRAFDWSAVWQQWKIEVVLRVFMMYYAKIYGPYDGSNFYLFQFKFWIHFRLTKTESIKEVPNWHWRRFMNKLFLVAWGLKCFKPFINLHVTIMWPVNSFYLFVNYFTVISLRKLNLTKPELVNFGQTQGCNLSLIMIGAIRVPRTCYSGLFVHKQSCPCPQNSGGHTFHM